MVQLKEKTVEELRKMASKKKIEGRSKMNKAQLVRALSKMKGGGNNNPFNSGKLTQRYPGIKLRIGNIIHGTILNTTPILSGTDIYGIVYKPDNGPSVTSILEFNPETEKFSIVAENGQTYLHIDRSSRPMP